jgi:O-succinylbenzoic acid--CoA ligase
MAFKIHKNFRLNGNKFIDNFELIKYSLTLSDGVSIFISDFLDETERINLQTSGSTGLAKVIEVKKRFMLNSAEATGNYFGLKEKTTVLLCMNLKYVGAKMMLLRAMLLGWHLDVVAPSLNPLKDLENGYDFSAMVPMQVHHSIANLNKIKTLIIGGGVVSNALVSSLQKVKTNCYATYGMTETVSHVAVQKLNSNTSLQGGTTKQSFYTLLPNIHISTDKKNCLIIDAPKVSATQISTNDIVEIISDSEFKWLGRYDNIINSGGIKLIPEQVEKKLAAIFTKRFFVSSVPDKILGERLILVIEDERDSNDILETVKNLQSLNKYETPKEVYFLPNFVETETKKIQRSKTLDLINFISE